ncbi:MAG: esterase-like activity of phytase family protein [Verrucomicrobiales bacterium]
MIKTARIVVCAALSWLCFCQATLAQQAASSLLRGLADVASETKNVFTGSSWPVVILKADGVWQLSIPGGDRFDASALMWTREGLLTLNDKKGAFYRIVIDEEERLAKIILSKQTFPISLLSPWITKKWRAFDFEGMAQDDSGRFYLCEEQRRAIFRYDPRSRQMKQLAIDWSPVAKYFSEKEKNASFEGIAIGGGKLFIANERSEARIIVVDMKSSKVTGHFLAKSDRFSFVEPHYSDLAYFDGHLYALLRHQQTILQIDPETTQVVAEYDFSPIENAANVEYLNEYPTGTMEGLAVDAKYFYLVTDNNGKGRKKFPKDIRPTLFRCPKPVVQLKEPKTK